ncbi:hypothetical protein D018_4174A, partial [Vibrio parahaemolyticus VP2007-007]|jgi:hypothetical protein
MNTT